MLAGLQVATRAGFKEAGRNSCTVTRCNLLHRPAVLEDAVVAVQAGTAAANITQRNELAAAPATGKTRTRNLQTYRSKQGSIGNARFSQDKSQWLANT